MTVKNFLSRPSNVDAVIRIALLACSAFGMFVPLASIKVLILTQKIFIPYIIVVSVATALLGERGEMFAKTQPKTPGTPFYIGSTTFLTCVILYFVGTLAGGFVDMLWYLLAVPPVTE